MGQKNWRKELIELYQEFLYQFKEKENHIYQIGGLWNKKPDFETFIQWLEDDYIE